MLLPSAGLSSAIVSDVDPELELDPPLDAPLAELELLELEAAPTEVTLPMTIELSGSWTSTFCPWDSKPSCVLLSLVVTTGDSGPIERICVPLGAVSPIVATWAMTRDGPATKATWPRWTIPSTVRLSAVCQA